MPGNEEAPAPPVPFVHVDKKASFKTLEEGEKHSTSLPAAGTSQESIRSAG